MHELWEISTLIVKMENKKNSVIALQGLVNMALSFKTLSDEN